MADVATSSLGYGGRAPRRRALLTPATVWQILEPLQNGKLDDLVREYEDAFAYIHDRRDRPTDEQRELVTGSRVSHETEDVALSHIGNRRKLVKAGHKIQGIERAVNVVLEIIADIFDEEEDDYQPLERIVLATQHETDQLKESKLQREKRDLQKEITRLQEREASLRRRLKEIA